jgi:tRNA dimethylallyltransferase
VLKALGPALETARDDKRAQADILMIDFMTQPILPSIICLMGPTASGKTQLAIDLVQRLPCEIISVDSAMVYRGMDIGTAKPTAAVLKIAPHRLLNIRDPAEAYSAAQFCDDALREVEDIIAQGKIPLLVGGTMMYFRALQKGLSDLPSANAEIREKLTSEALQCGWPAMHERLVMIDPVAAQRIHPHDSQRIQRALEVYEISGKNLTSWQQQGAKSLFQYQVINLAVSPVDRAVLHERIAQRFAAMLAEGFMDEVQRLFQRGDLTLETPAIRSVGYRQAWEYLLGQYSFETMQEKAVIATRQLAKRQLTWLRHWPQELRWFDSLHEELAVEAVEYLVRQIPGLGSVG